MTPATFLVALGALCVVAAIVLALLQPEISERTFYTGEVYAGSGILALLGVISAAIGLRKRPAGAGRTVAKITVGVGGLIAAVVLVAFTLVFIWAWLVYG